MTSDLSGHIIENGKFTLGGTSLSSTKPARVQLWEAELYKVLGKLVLRNSDMSYFSSENFSEKRSSFVMRDQFGANNHIITIMRFLVGQCTICYCGNVLGRNKRDFTIAGC